MRYTDIFNLTYVEHYSHAANSVPVQCSDSDYMNKTLDSSRNERVDTVSHSDMSKMLEIGLGRPWTDLLGESEEENGQSALVIQPQEEISPIVAHRDGQTGDVCVQIGEYTYPIELEPTSLDHATPTFYRQPATYHTDNRNIQGLYSNEFTHRKSARFSYKISNNRHNAKNQTSKDDLLSIRGTGGKNNQSSSLTQKLCAYKQYYSNHNTNEIYLDNRQNCCSLSQKSANESGKEWYEDLAQYNEDIHFAPKLIQCQSYCQNLDIARTSDNFHNFSVTLPPVSEMLAEHDNYLYTQAANNLEFGTDVEVNPSSTVSNCSKLLSQPKYDFCVVGSSNLCPLVPDHTLPDDKRHSNPNKMKSGEHTRKGESSLPHLKEEMNPNHNIGQFLSNRAGTPDEYHRKLEIKKQLKKMKRGCRLWEFIRNLLLDPATNPSLIRWENRSEGTFKLVQSKAIAHKWGMKKGNEGMTYEKLSRAMRYYYKRQVFQPVLGKRLVYRFGPRATGWKDA